MKSLYKKGADDVALLTRYLSPRLQLFLAIAIGIPVIVIGIAGIIFGVPQLISGNILQFLFPDNSPFISLFFWGSALFTLYFAKPYISPRYISPRLHKRWLIVLGIVTILLGIVAIRSGIAILIPK